MADKPRLFIKQDRHVTTFQVRGNRWCYVTVMNDCMRRDGAANTIRKLADQSAQNGNHRSAAQKNLIADILDGVAQ